MNINSVNSYGSMMHDYKLSAIPQGKPEELQQVKQQAVQTSPIASAGAYGIREDAFAVSARRDAALEDISLTFNKQDDFGFLGQNSDIHSLDVEKAISDMQKDKVLQQYQYFVGSARNLMSGVDEMDGIVLAKF